jgi:hypothetical protein
MAARCVDYSLTKADNRVIRARMALMAKEIERSSADMENAREADRQVRALLAMPSVKPAGAQTGIGGPSDAERSALVDRFVEDPAHVNPAVVHERLQSLRREFLERVESLREISGFIELKRRLSRAMPLGWPTAGRITSGFGYRASPMQSRSDEDDADEFHPGVDIANALGTPIYATADGVVKSAGWAGGYGRMLCLSHAFGYMTLFGHTSRILVTLGEKVARGQLVAVMGSTGRSTGSHLHYEVWRNGKLLNPLPFLRKSPPADDQPLREPPLFSKVTPWPGSSSSKTTATSKSS